MYRSDRSSKAGAWHEGGGPACAYAVCDCVDRMLYCPVDRASVWLVADCKEIETIHALTGERMVRYTGSNKKIEEEVYYEV